MTKTSAVVYLDYAAATPLDERVLTAMQPYFGQQFYNPSATYLPARAVRAALETARSRVAQRLGARSSEITFTAGGSEANNLAIHGLMRRYPGANIVVSAIEHESVLAAARRYDCREVAVAADGTVDLVDLARKIDDRTVLVSVMYANNEVGTIQPIKDVARVVRTENEERRTGNGESGIRNQEPGRGTSQESRVTSQEWMVDDGGRIQNPESRIQNPESGTDDVLPLYLHSDACQAANYLDLHVARLGVDLLTLNGGKLYGPKQSGGLYVKAGIELQPLIDGGGQEHGLRSGTENVAGAVGFAAALDVAQTMRQEEVKRLQDLQRKFLNMLSERIPTGVINGPAKHRLPNNVHLTIPGFDNERVLLQLEAAGILTAAGSACSASNQEPSHVLRAIGLSDADARASLRLTMGRQTTEHDIERTVTALAKIVTAQ